MLALLLFALAVPTPDCSIAPGFTQDGEVREFNTDTLFEYMNGNSEGYFLYGFQQMRGVSCKKGDVKLIVDLSEFKTPELAYGMFTGNLDARQKTEKIGAGGQVTQSKVIFVKGQYYAEIAAEPQGEHGDLLRAAAQAWEKKLTGSTGTPQELTWFPTEKIQPGYPRLVPQSVLGMRLLKRGYIAQYEDGRAFVVTEANPEAATALMKQLAARYNPVSPSTVADESFTANDKYLGQLCIFRKGSRVVGWTNAPSQEQAVSQAGKLAATLP